MIAIFVVDDQRLVRRFMEAGGAGYVSKGADIEELCRAIRTVAGCSPYISQGVAQRVAANDVQFAIIANAQSSVRAF